MPMMAPPRFMANGASSGIGEEDESDNRFRRVLSIQSHVVHGYAGNKCAVFPLQLHGFDVDFINSVQFSNHTGYAHVRGQRLTETELGELYTGLQLNGIDHYSHILTGYCGNESFLRKIGGIVQDQRQKYSKLIFVCDPVMGDNGEYYVPKSLMPVYRDQIIPIADVVTPNQFELSELTGIPIEKEADCLRAIAKLHELGVGIVVNTSGTISPDPEIMYAYASSLKKDGGYERFRFHIPLVKTEGPMVGTGDVFASLLIVWLDALNGDIRTAVSKVIGTLIMLLRKTTDNAPKGADLKLAVHRELHIIQCRWELLKPTIEIESVEL